MSNRFDIDTNWRMISGVISSDVSFTSVYVRLMYLSIFNKVCPVVHFLTCSYVHFMVASLAWNKLQMGKRKNVTINSTSRNVFDGLFPGTRLHFLQNVEGDEQHAKSDAHKNAWWFWKVFTPHVYTSCLHDDNPSTPVHQITAKTAPCPIKGCWTHTDTKILNSA